MIDRTSLKVLQEARDKLIDKIIATRIDSDVDKLMPLIDAVDDVSTAFDVENNIATEQ